MANRKEYEMLLRLGAQMNGEFARTFRAAQSELSATQKEVQALGRTQADISAYQKQQAAIDGTKKKLEVLQQQYNNIQKEISETGTYSSDLENKLLSKQQQIEKTSDALGRQTQRLDELRTALHEAGVDTSNLGQESTRLGKKIDELAEQERQAADGAEDFGDRSTEALEAVQSALAALGITKLLHAIYDEFRACVDASVEFESAMTGVAKTTDLTDAEFAAMSDAVQDLSTEIPATTTELAAIAETAGQLGIEKNSLLDFTEVMAMLGTATNMTSEEAATMLAQFASITGMDPKLYSNLGSAIVDLGNNFATTEKNIADMSQTIAAAGSIAGMSEADIVGIAAAVTSLGISAQNGGTQMTKLISEINSAVSSGEGLEEWANVAGMSADAFAQAWGNDAANALDAFIIGLNGAYSSGQDVYGILSDLGITETRMVTMITSLAKSGTRLTDTLNVSNQAWVKNTALTGEAEKRYATTESKLVLMQNAYNNLKVAVGDNYTPALQKLYEIGTKVLKNITDFVTAHPGAVKAITILVATVGGYVAALTAYVVIAKLAKIAQDLLNASMLANPFVLAATAIIGVTAALFALAASAEDTVPSVKELTEAAREMEDAMDESKTTCDDTVTSTMAAASVADTYIDKLDALEAAGQKSSEAQSEYQNTLALLLQVMPSLSDCISETTDQYGRTIYTLNTTTDALRTNTEAWRENAMMQAYQEQLTAMYASYSDVLIEAEKNSIGLTRAQTDLDNANQKLTNAYDRMDEMLADAQAQADAYYEEYGFYADATAFLSQEYQDLSMAVWDYRDEINTAERSIKNYNKALEEDADAVAAAEAEIALAEEAVKKLTGATEEGTGADAAAAAQKEELLNIIGRNTDRMTALTEEYNAAYDAAWQSIDGQIGLFDTMSVKVDLSVGEMIESLESQVEYMNTYSDNLRAAAEMGLSEGLLAQLSDGSAESAAYLQAIVDDGGEKIAELNAAFAEVKQGKDDFADTVADMKTNFTVTMDEMQKELAADIEAMNLGAEAAASGMATIQGFIDGAKDMLPAVQAAYAHVANTARSALRPSGTTGSNIPGYAVGTQSAAPGFALVGENGPELVYFNGGEQVMTAAETAAMRNSLSIQTVAFAPQLMEAMSAAGRLTAPAISANSESKPPVSIQITFDIKGNATPEAVEDLRAYGDEFADRVLEVLESAGIDAARRAYT